MLLQRFRKRGPLFFGEDKIRTLAFARKKKRACVLGMLGSISSFTYDLARLRHNDKSNTNWPTVVSTIEFLISALGGRLLNHCKELPNINHCIARKQFQPFCFMTSGPSWDCPSGWCSPSFFSRSFFRWGIDSTRTSTALALALDLLQLASGDPPS